MKVLNFGSLNIDLVYRVRDFVRPGETIAAQSFSRFAGGKGLNQSIALARAGAKVLHAGAVGKDGGFLLELLRENGVDHSLVAAVEDTPTGHAAIQVADSGENSIVLYTGANHRITGALIERALSATEPGDILLLQNEISSMNDIMRRAAERGLRIFFNPAPMTKAVAEYPLELVDTLIVNETEWEALSACRSDLRCHILKTLGAKGAVYDDDTFVPARRIEKVVDTTAAGDTFIGFFIADLLAGKDVESAMKTAASASAWCIQRAGAAPSIPRRSDLGI
jgi:ribokinase